MHGEALKRSLDEAVAEALARRSEATVKVEGAKPGIYLQFESQPGLELKLQSFERERKGIELVAVTHGTGPGPEPELIERAVVFVPDGQVKHFISQFAKYATDTPKKKGEVRHEAMLDPVASLKLAALRELWTDAAEAYPAEDEIIWWELWLRRHDGNELERLQRFARAKGLALAPRRLVFAERIVTLLHASAAELSDSLDVLDDVAELRKAKETATFFSEMAVGEQDAWVVNLTARTSAPAPDAPAVCVLDTGVNRAHPLINPALDVTDVHSFDPLWGKNDHDGHGTEMAGLALFGDLTPHLAGNHPVHHRHRLESVKILPPRTSSANDPDLYGAVMAQAASLVEIQAEGRRRVFSMSVAATDERDRGQPTSWSAAIDALAAGRSIDPGRDELVYLDDGLAPRQRLFVVCAGNVGLDQLTVNHLDRSDTEPIHDPGQAWNALTVGAFTDHALLSDPKWSAHVPVAKAGDLSPWSTTGVTFATDWPIKPDVVMEGGNVAVSPAGEVEHPVADLNLLSTNYIPIARALRLSWATSAATAQAARLAAIISAEYPELWPETVRGLVVHSAQWTPPMLENLEAAPGKRARGKLVERYGFGVPSLERALRSASDALTLISQSSIRPFLPKPDTARERQMGEIQFFSLPWPRATLMELGELPVRLRVTLSYFIEPNPGRRGWRTRHRYASHGLRFDLIGPGESTEEFRKRRNQLALTDNEDKPDTAGDSGDWYLGENARTRGSIHSDILVGNTAAQLAARSTLAVYPVSGWWKDQPARDRSHKGARFALLVSIETPGAEADIWTPVAQQVGIPMPVEV